jgi:hypothetical protein
MVLAAAPEPGEQSAGICVDIEDMNSRTEGK